MSAATATRSQLALQSYLDALLQEATFEDTGTSRRDAASACARAVEACRAGGRRSGDTGPGAGNAAGRPRVRRVRGRGARGAGPRCAPGSAGAGGPARRTDDALRELPVEPRPHEVIELRVPSAPASVGEPPLLDLPLLDDGRPAWAAEPFECLLFDVAGLTLAVPLVCLGSIYPLENQERPRCSASPTGSSASCRRRRAT